MSLYSEVTSLRPFINIFYTLPFLFFYGCSSTPKGEVPEAPSIEGQRSLKCSPFYLCATGEGETLREAKQNARGEIAKTIRVKIESQSTLKQRIGDTLESSLGESFSKTYRENVNEELSGIEIIRHFKKNNVFYAFARVRKDHLRKNYSSQIRSIDLALQGLVKGRQRTSLGPMKLLLKGREKLSQKRAVVGGASIPMPVVISDLHRIEQIIMGRALLLNVAVAPDDFEFKSFILSELSTLNVQESKKSSSQVDVDWSERPAHLKVKGFKKTEVTAGLKHIGKGVEGAFTVKSSGTGRTEGQARKNAFKKLKEKIKKNLYKLNLKY